VVIFFLLRPQSGASNRTKRGKGEENPSDARKKEKRRRNLPTARDCGMQGGREDTVSRSLSSDAGKKKKEEGRPFGAILGIAAAPRGREEGETSNPSLWGGKKLHYSLLLLQRGGKKGLYAPDCSP